MRSRRLAPPDLRASSADFSATRTGFASGSGGTIHLGRIDGIDVFLPWYWFLVAAYLIHQGGFGRYSSVAWAVLEFVALFAIVALHELAHAVACRQVGGVVRRVELWPLTGVASVRPPRRPGATLWSFAAGPLVHVALMLLLGIAYVAVFGGSINPSSDSGKFLGTLRPINLVLLIYSVLPVFPMDGGQILRSLLWYAVGRVRSLMATVVVGFFGVAAMGLLAIRFRSVAYAMVAIYAAFQCANGYKQARMLKRVAQMPRREGVACPSCNTNPPQGSLWSCRCGTAFDAFEVQATCPKCRGELLETKCPDCEVLSPYADWISAGRAPKTEVASPPSIVPVVLGVIASLGALLLLSVGILSLFVSFDTPAQQPQYQAEIEQLWLSEGIAIPGEQTLSLRRGQRYDAYIECAGAAPNMRKCDGVDISVVYAESGEELSVTHSYHRLSDSFQRNGRTLFPEASFVARRLGRYTIRTSTRLGGPTDARIKIGPSFRLVTGSIAAMAAAIGVAAFVLTLFLVAMAVLLFFNYGRRRKEFNLVLEKKAS